MSMKRTVILFPAAFMMSISLQMINFTVIFFLKDMVGISASSIGWFFAAGSGGYVLGCMALRPVQNRLVPPASIYIAVAMTIFSLLMIKESTSPATVLICYLIFSTAPAFFWPQVMGWFSYGLDNNELGKSISRFNISWSSGVLCGPLLGGILAERNIMMSFYIAIAMISAIALILFLGLIFINDMRRFPAYSKRIPSGPATHEAGIEEEPETDDELLNDGKGTIMRFGGWIGVFSVYVILALINNIFPLFIRDTLGLGESSAGNMLFIRGLTTAIGFYIAGKITFWHFNRKVMLITQVAAIIIPLVLLIVNSIAIFYIVFIIFGLFFSLAYTNGIFHGSAGALDRGRRMALFESILTLGVITGSIGGGYLYQYTSIYTAFGFCAAIAGTGLILQIVIFVTGRHKNLV